jgi:ABC-type multidrug transport system ATPase subunit
MQKRLSIARAILHRPALLLLDEPEAGLDRESVSMLDQLLRGWTAGGRTVLMTTHNLELGVAWADRVGVLSGGKIDFQRPKAQLDLAGFRQVLTASAEATR